MDLVAIDSAGVEVARSDTPVAVYTMPWPCDDGNTCFSGYLDGADEYGEWQVSVQEGNISVTERPPVDPTDIPVLDGVSVREVTIDGEDRLRRIDSGDVRWERSFEELGLTTGRDAVAGGTRYADAVYIHNIYYTDEEWSAELEIPLADHQLIALDLDSGEELWRRRGAGLCGGATDDVSRVVLVCEGSGNATVDYTTGLLTFSEATKVSVAGVDEHTGQELWSRDITGEDWTAMDGRLSRPVDSSVEVLQQRGESVLVTPETGKRLTGGEGLPDGYTCFSSRPYDSDGEQIIRSDFLFFACTASGDIQAPPTALALDALLVDTPHDVDIVTDPHGISRFP